LCSIKLQTALAKALPRMIWCRAELRMRSARDVRVICTTSRDLKPLLDTGEFFRDLYYQISILPI